MAALPGDLEAYLLLLLADSNLPTGGFVASSALESTMQHGLLSPTSAQAALVDFTAKSLQAYARLTVPFLNDAYTACSPFLASADDTAPTLDDTVRSIEAIDRLHDAVMLSHVARRASKAQGAALLTLYARSFAPSPRARADQLFAHLRTSSRTNDGDGRAQFDCHLAVCWAVLSAALSLPPERARHLYLFLHARSILSAAVRLNLIGPYIAQRLLLYEIREGVEKAAKWSAGLSAATKEASVAPANVWPLQEILASRHDCLASRIFNS